MGFVHALVSAASCKVQTCVVDDDSVDLEVIGPRELGPVRRSPHLAIQLKCTETDDCKGDTLAFAVKMKNYNDLREPTVHVPAILVVLCVPAETGLWLAETPEQTAMRRVAYWTSLRGMADSTNSTSVTVHLQRSARFTVDALTGIMTRIANGEFP